MSTQALEESPETQEHGEIPAYILECAETIAHHDKRLRAMSPPCKLTPALAVRLLATLREGAHYEPACALAGISYRAFREWMNRAEDEDDEGPFAALAHAVKVAEAEAEVETVRDVRKASKDNRFWAAGMTFLERRHSDRWRRPDSAQQVNVNVGVALGVQVSDEQRRAIVPSVQIPSINGEVVQAGHTADTAQTFASDASLSPVPRND